jgi:hypothetical protein
MRKFRELLKGILSPINFYIVGGFFLVFSSACVPMETQEAVVEDTPTATVTASATPTVDWFPATPTPTSMPTLAITQTPESSPKLGDVIFEDDFSDPESWDLGHSAVGNVSLGLNEITIAIAEPQAYQDSIRQEPVLSDYFIEVKTMPTLCQGEDQYGLILRMSSPNDFYRYAISCDGRVRLDRVISGTATSPQPWLQNTSIPPGALITSRLGAWLEGDELRFFINDQLQFTVKDPSLVSGNIGLFARSQGETAVTVNFSDLVVREIPQ